MLFPLGVAARRLEISRERLKQLADAGQVTVVRDVLGRRFVEAEELERVRRERSNQRRQTERRRRLRLLRERRAQGQL